MGAGILLSGADDIDFMIHGVFQYELFGQKLWVTTTHVCLFIVMAIIIIFCLCANRAVKRATEVPGAFQNVVELVVEMLDNMIKVLWEKMRQPLPTISAHCSFLSLSVTSPA